MTDEAAGPLPAWAKEMADRFAVCWGEEARERGACSLARLLASIWYTAMTTVRKALSESCVCRKVGDRVVYGDGYQGYRVVTRPETCIQCATILILAKAGPPREATR